jgi:hypothetical protein
MSRIANVDLNFFHIIHLITIRNLLDRLALMVSFVSIRLGIGLLFSSHPGRQPLRIRYDVMVDHPLQYTTPRRLFTSNDKTNCHTMVRNTQRGPGAGNQDGDEHEDDP